MSATAAPYGLIPVKKLGDNPNQGGGARAYPITTNVATPMAVGQLVELNAGVISVPSGAPTKALGVISGFDFTDPIMRYALQDSMLPANAINSGYTNIKVFVNDDPNQLYKVQATGSLDQTAVGKKADLSNNASVTVPVKRSSGSLNAASAGTGATVIIVGFFDSPATKPGDAFTDVLVKVAPAVHLYTATA
jgi:hypothetical protein